MGIRFSLVYPTRHRPAFIGQALRFLEKQGYRDFEVIVSDNYIDPALSCEHECRNSALSKLKYVRPPKPLGMVENWNYALQFASGDYICYFTDKMFLLPHALSMANTCIERSSPEIINWADNSYTSKKFPDYFGEGLYELAYPAAGLGEFSYYNPQAELSKKGLAEVSRNEQDKSEYARGKICFGAFSLDLCNRIVKRMGALFHIVSPDYTSMILGLSTAQSAVELARPGIVHVNTDLSNGGQGSIHDQMALDFLNAIGDAQEILKNCLVPGLYCSPHNAVTHDYLTLKDRFKLNFQFDAINWLIYITEDLDVQGRQWSSEEVENQQRRILQGFVDRLSQSDRLRYQNRLAGRAGKRKAKAPLRNLKRLARAVIPESFIMILINWLRYLQPGIALPYYCSSIEDVLNHE